MTETFLVQKDTRGRISIGQYSDADRFVGHYDSVGRIVLEPAVVVAESVHRLVDDADFVARMTEAASQPAAPLDLDDL